MGQVENVYMTPDREGLRKAEIKNKKINHSKVTSFVKLKGDNTRENKWPRAVCFLARVKA